MDSCTQIKVVGKSGQISLGKRYAGKPLRAEYRADGVVVLTPVALVPEAQLWTLAEPHRTRIAEGMAWAALNPPAETDLDALLRRTRSRRRNSRAAR
ncbi:MAG: hypothetical protein HY744_03020 [Deltaproteobacteria bacterium]|nr:hypothetical protein [Deltaproteobacteria bacterium]